MTFDPKRVKEIFLEAADLADESARAAYLERACEGDPGLRARVEVLLRSHDPEGSFLGTPAAVVPDPAQATTGAFVPGAESSAARAKAGTPDSEALRFLEPATRPDVLGRLGHYEVLQVLGQGGFGIVFRAFDNVLHRVVAVKVLSQQMAATSPARRRFLREAQSSAQVRHENVVQVYEVGEQPLPFLVMEFIPGETLQQRLDRVGPLDVAEVVRLGQQIAEGLAAAHACDLIHRDIKPGNILLEGGSHKAKITDFGLARAADDASISQSGFVAGTPMYMAPEQAKGESLDQRADLFSLGSVLYQMVTGRPPFRAPSTLAVLKRVAEEQPRSIHEIIPETPQWLCDIIAKLHAKNPDERYQSAREVADVLADCEAQLKAKEKVKNVLPTSKPVGGRWVAAAALVLPVLALAVTEITGVTQLFRGQPTSPDSLKPGNGPASIPVAKQQPLPPTFTNSIGMELILVPKGKSLLGGGKDKLGEKEIVIPADFYLGKFEVTQEEWEKVMGENPSYFSHTGDGKDAVKDFTNADLKRFPVEQVTWIQCQAFVAKLNEHENETGWVYRLPTAVEWEYACRGGPMTDVMESAFDYYLAKPSNTLLLQQANIGSDNGLHRTCKVGQFEANRLGLFDMHGNVFEWCEDTYVNKAEGGALHRMFKGGSWFLDPAQQHHGRAWEFAASTASANAYYLGLRLARVRVAPQASPDTVERRNGPASIPVAKQQPLPPTFTNSIGMELVLVPKGKAWLGGGGDELGDREVTIPADFYLGKYEVTQEEWQNVMGENPSHFTRTGSGRDSVKDFTEADLNRFPVEQVTWNQCRTFAAKLTEREKEKGWVYRLPTEAEWEYACRGGPLADRASCAFDFYFARPTRNLRPEQANFGAAKGLNRTCKVGRYEANPLGLFDMHGNVWEWCDGPSERTREKPYRGGSWGNDAEFCRAVTRTTALPKMSDIATGLRLARVRLGVPPPEVKSPPAVARFTDADVQRIAALSAAEQVEEVRKELLRRNPGFDGQITHKITDGVVTELRIGTDNVTDITPIRVFNALQHLNCSGTATNNQPNGQLADLALEGMNLTNLTHLDLRNTQVSDANLARFQVCKNLTILDLQSTKVTDAGLAHFKDCTNVTDLNLIGTKVTDAGLANFKDCRGLKALGLVGTKVSDIGLGGFASLENLTFVNLAGTCVTDAGLSYLKDCRNLRSLTLEKTPVSDKGLVHIKDCPNLAILNLSGTKVTDAGLENLQGLPLKLLGFVDTEVTDLRPLRGMNLEEIRLTPKNITQGLDVLRDMKSLKTIGIGTMKTPAWPAAEFWERYDKGEFAK